MKRIKPEDITLTQDFTTVPPPKRFVPSPHFFQHPTNRMPLSYHPYNSGQNFMYASGAVQIPPPPSNPPPQQWQFQKLHPPPSTPPPLPIPQRTPPPPPNRHPLVFDPTQPPPSFSNQEHRNSPGPPIIPNKISIPPTQLPTNPLMLHHPQRLRGRGRGQYRGTGVIGSFDRGGRIRNPTPNIMNPLSVKPPQLLFNMNNTQQQQQKLPNGLHNCPMIEVDCTDDNQTHINKKSKRKPMSTRYTRAKEWDRDDANKALDLEKEFNRLQRTPMLILKFPDPDLNKYIVKKYSQSIETVHFQQPSTPRYCFVQLKEGSDIEKVRKELCEIPFGTGKITAERKFQHTEEGQEVTPEEIDPYTLYIGNLPTQISVKTVKENFPKATRIDIGYAQRMKYTRYAFIRYSNVDDSMEAYKKTFNTLIANRSLIVRFRRAKGNIGLPGESKTPNPRKAPTTSSTKTSSEIITTLPKNSPIDNQISEIITTETNESSILLNHNNLLTDGIEDTKVNVLRDAQMLLKENSTITDNILGSSSITDTNLTIKTESENLPYPVLPITNGILPFHLLGTRIKDEPVVDDDELLAQAQCYEDDDMDDYDYDSEPEEEDDDFDDTIKQNPSVPLIKPTTEECHESENWEELRQAELTSEETKPDLNTLLPLADDSDYNRTQTKLPDAFAKKPDKENVSLTNNINYNDDLDELFNSMNPENEKDELDF